MCDILKFLILEGNSVWIFINLIDDCFKVYWCEFIWGNDLWGFFLGKIFRKENKLFFLGLVVKFYFWLVDEI